MKEFNIIKVHRKVLFLGGGRRGEGRRHEKQIYNGEIASKRGIGQFADLRESC